MPIIGHLITYGQLGKNGTMAEQDDKKLDASNPPEELYGVAEPDPDLALSRFQPIIPEVVDDDLDNGRTHEGFGENFRLQFTIADLFMVTTALAVLLGTMSMLRWKWQYAAGLAGFGAFASLLVITIAEPERQVVKTLWWSFFVFYLLACAAAVFVG